MGEQTYKIGDIIDDTPPDYSKLPDVTPEECDRVFALVREAMQNGTYDPDKWYE